MSTILHRKRLACASAAIAQLISVAQGAHIPIARQGATIPWFACPDSSTTQCAFFDVPMDYTNPNDTATVSIFMRKFPATVPADQRLGSILTNPGGPGGSGSAYIAAAGQSLSTLVEGRYDIIGFDPRGVNLTGPSTACRDLEAKFVLQAYQLQLAGVPFPPKSAASDREVVKRIAAIQESHPAACLQNGNKQMLEHVGTVDVVQDMVKMVEALGEDGINFWGYSYGTILGATFAAIRPDLVKRMVLDGVSDSEAYFNGPLEWGRHSLDDSNKTLTGFFETCIEAGPELCPFSASRDGSNKTETVAGLRKRVEAIYSKLADQPLTVGDSLVGPGVLTASDIQLVLFGLLYTPQDWPLVTEALLQVENRNGSDLYGALYQSFFGVQPKPYNQNVFNRSMQDYSTRETLVPIACSDSAPLNISVDAYTQYFRELGKTSPIGEQWALIMGSCRNWPFRARHRYTGPWTTAKGLKKTRFPILFMSLDADPVTPLPAAVKMSRGFGKDSATLLVQRGYGHCTIAHPSLCTLKNVRDYFVDGKVPANGTHCEPEPGFIYPVPGNGTNTKRATSQLSKRDVDLLEALEVVHNTRSHLLPYA